MKAVTTLSKIRAHAPCASGWTTLLKGLGKTAADDEPLELVRVLEINGLDDALWALRACDGIDRAARLYACDMAAAVAHLANNARCDTAIAVARRFANGTATSDELDAARDAARDAAWYAAGDAAGDAAWDAAWDAAGAAAGAAAWDAAGDLFRARFGQDGDPDEIVVKIDGLIRGGSK